MPHAVFGKVDGLYTGRERERYVFTLEQSWKIINPIFVGLRGRRFLFSPSLLLLLLLTSCADYDSSNRKRGRKGGRISRLDFRLFKGLSLFL